MPELLRFIVEEKYNDTNAGRYLRTVCRLSARTLALLKRTTGSILCNGKLLRTIDKIYTGDIIEITLPSEKNEITPVAGDLDIIYEDEFLIVVNKPFGMPVHPVKVHQEDTLANIIAFKYMNSEFVFRASNRLDRDTSGAVIIAKDRHTASLLQKTEIEKHYTAVCHGVPDECGTVDAPIALREDSKIVRTVCEDGQKAVTHYKVIKKLKDSAVLDLWLETGRTHQIRCHMSYIGHPLFGDDLYNGSKELISRQALHCRSVSFVHPVSGEYLSLTTELPFDITQLINMLAGGDCNEKS